MQIKIEKSRHLKPKPPVEELGFGKFFTDHMFIMEYSVEKGWHNPEIKPYGPLEINPAAMVLHYGQAAFEGLKCYRSPEGRFLLFRPWDNFKRLNISCERLCAPLIDEDFALQALLELIKIDHDWTPESSEASLYIRPFFLATEPSVGVHPSGCYLFIIILSPVGPYYREGFNPVKIYVEDEYVRAVRGGLGFTKATANYAASLKGQEKARQLGYAQVLWLDGVERKYIEEVGAMNVFFVVDGELLTPSLEGSILSGLTRDSVIKLAQNNGMNVNERRISIHELYEAHEQGRLNEAFGSGTAAVITPIGELNWSGRKIEINNGNTGPISREMYDTLTGIQYGRKPDPFNWMKEVEI